MEKHNILDGSKVANAADKLVVGRGRKRRVLNVANKIAVRHSDFLGKTCSMTESVQWAYENCTIEDVKPHEAPSAMAWCLLNDFRESPQYKLDVIKGVIIAKTKKDEAKEEFGGGNFDGKAEYDILSRIGGSEARSAVSQEVDGVVASENPVDDSQKENGL